MNFISTKWGSMIHLIHRIRGTTQGPIQTPYKINHNCLTGLETGCRGLSESSGWHREPSADELKIEISVGVIYCYFTEMSYVEGPPSISLGKKEDTGALKSIVTYKFNREPKTML